MKITDVKTVLMTGPCTRDPYILAANDPLERNGATRLNKPEPLRSGQRVTSVFDTVRLFKIW